MVKISGFISKSSPQPGQNYFELLSFLDGGISEFPDFQESELPPSSMGSVRIQGTNCVANSK